MNRLPHIAVLFFLCLAGCESQPAVEQKTEATFAVYLKADKESRLSEIRFDDQIFKDMDSFETYFQKKGVSGDATFEFIDEANEKNRHTMKAAAVARAGKQRQAVAWVKELEGRVIYDYQNDKYSQLPEPDWLRELIGIDYLNDVSEVFLRIAPTENLPPLKGLAKLKELNLDFTPVTDFSPLAGLTNLETLNLDGTLVTDLWPLAGLTNLKELELSYSQVSDLSPLEGLTNLERLRLNEIPVTDLWPLAGLTNLKELWLANTQVKDLAPLKGLTKLEKLNLDFTPVSKEEIQKIQKALPRCEVMHHVYFLADVEQQENTTLDKIKIDRIKSDVEDEIKKARERMADDPKGVEYQMEVVRDLVLASEELPSEIRTQLVARIDAYLRQARRMRLRQEELVRQKVYQLDEAKERLRLMKWERLTPPPPSHRPFQFSRRTVLIFMLLVLSGFLPLVLGVLFVRVGYKVSKVIRKKILVSRNKKMDGEKPPGTVPSENADPLPRRRWYQYNLRSLLMMMLVLSLLFATAGYIVRKAEHQKAAGKIATEGEAVDPFSGEPKSPGEKAPTDEAVDPFSDESKSPGEKAPTDETVDPFSDELKSPREKSPFGEAVDPFSDEPKSPREKSPFGEAVDPFSGEPKSPGKKAPFGEAVDPFSDGPSPLLDVKQQKRITIEQIKSEVEAEIKRARERMVDDPKGVWDQMKILKETVYPAPELPLAIRSRLVARIDAVLRQARRIRMRQEELEIQKAAQLAEAEEESQPPPPLYRPFQFSLRSVLIFILLLVLTVLFVLAGYKVRKVRAKNKVSRSEKMDGEKPPGTVPSENTDPHPRRRWYQYSLRSLMLMILVLSLLFAWAGNLVRKAERQKAAVAWLKENEGRVVYDYERKVEGIVRPVGPPPGPDWLHQWMGNDYFGNVTQVHWRAEVKDLSPLADLPSLEMFWAESPVKDLSPLAGLTNLKELNLIYTQVNDLTPLEDLTNLKKLDLRFTFAKDLSPLKGLTNLEQLYLRHTPVTDLSPLKDLANLKVLGLRDTQVKDFSPLAGLTNLETLWLRDTQVTDLSPLAGLTKLEKLWLNDTPVTDLSPLAGLTNLKVLNLRGTHVSDLSPLKSLANLEWLSLGGTPVSDLSPLAGLTNLKSLGLLGTQVSKEELQKLKKALPNCKIYLRQPHRFP